MIERQAPGTANQLTLGADKAFDTPEFVGNLRQMNVTPHVARKVRKICDRRPHDAPRHLRNQPAKAKAHRGGIRLGQDHRRLGQGQGARAGARAPLLHSRNGGLQVALGQRDVVDGPCERDEAHGDQAHRDCRSIGCPLGDHEILSAAADRNDKPAAGLQLLYQCGWHMVGSGGHDDRVEGRLVLPSGVTVADAGRIIGVAETFQSLRGLHSQRPNDFVRLDFACEQRRDCGLVARAGTDLQHFSAGLQRQRIGHQGDDEGL